MEERAFNLCREPWICVLDRDYRVKKLSLYEVLTQSSRYMALAGRRRRRISQSCAYFWPCCTRCFTGRMKRETVSLWMITRRLCAGGKLSGNWESSQRDL